MRRPVLLLVLVLLAVALPSVVQAAVNCQIRTLVGVNFGAYSVFAPSPLTSTGSLSIRCVGIGAGVSPISVSLSPGVSGSFQPRKMTKIGDTLNYNLYLDPNGARIWGDGTSGTQIYSAAVSNNQLVNLTIFGRIPPGQDVSVGAYTDTIVLTVNF